MLLRPEIEAWHRTHMPASWIAKQLQNRDLKVSYVFLSEMCACVMLTGMHSEKMLYDRFGRRGLPSRRTLKLTAAADHADAVEAPHEHISSDVQHTETGTSTSESDQRHDPLRATSHAELESPKSQPSRPPNTPVEDYQLCAAFSGIGTFLDSLTAKDLRRSSASHIGIEMQRLVANAHLAVTS